MAHEPKDIKDSLVLFEKDFQLDRGYLNLVEHSTFSYDQAYLKIMRVVEDLLERDFSTLINTLYRIDVSEEQLKNALAKSSDNPAATIADMILKRELQKVITRRKYS